MVSGYYEPVSTLSYWDGWAKLAFLDSKRRCKEIHPIFKIGSNTDKLLIENSLKDEPSFARKFHPNSKHFMEHSIEDRES